jgi:hypothetical protein
MSHSTEVEENAGASQEQGREPLTTGERSKVQPSCGFSPWGMDYTEDQIRASIAVLG